PTLDLLPIRRLPRPTPFPYTTLFRSFRCPTPSSRESRSHRFRRSSSAIGERARRALPSRRRRSRSNERAGREHQEGVPERRGPGDRKSTRLNSSHVKISYAVFCLKKK